MIYSKFILLLIFLDLVSSATVQLKFEEEVELTKSANSFTIPYSSKIKSMVLYAYHSFTSGIAITINYSSITYSQVIQYPGAGALLNFKEGKSIQGSFNFQGDSNKTVRVFLHELEKEISIDLSKKVELPYAVYSSIEGDEITGELVYSVQNLSRDIPVIFKYEKEIKASQLVVNCKNPYKVCHGTDCQEDVNTYVFKKGEQYKIYLKLTSTSYMFVKIYAIPSISFYELKCQGKYVLLPGETCIDECDPVLYTVQNDNECGLCKDINSTFPYKFINDTICRKEKPNNTYFYDESKNVLAICHSSCSSCSGPRDNECLDCVRGTAINGTCYYYTNCPIGYYSDYPGCGKCSPNCLTCDYRSLGDNNHCTSCDKNQILVKAIYFDQNCVDKCPEKTVFIQETNTCEEEKTKVWLWIVISVASVLVIVIIAFVLIKVIRSKKANNTEENSKELRMNPLMEKEE